MDKKIIAYFPLCVNCAVVILDIMYGIDDFVCSAYFNNGIIYSTGKNKLYSSNKGTYFKKGNKRYYLDKFMKM